MTLPVEVLSTLALSLCAIFFGAFSFLVRHAFNSIIGELRGLRSEVKELRESASNWRILESRVELLETQLMKVLGE